LPELSIRQLFGRVDGQRNGLKHCAEIKKLKISKDDIALVIVMKYKKNLSRTAQAGIQKTSVLPER
jgi:hypothetical protein